MIYNLHLESKANDELRSAQVEEVLADVARLDPLCAFVVAGDFNLDISRSKVASGLASAGFQDAISAPRTLTTPAKDLFGIGRRIDWAFRSWTSTNWPWPGTQPIDSIRSLPNLVHADCGR